MGATNPVEIRIRRKNMKAYVEADHERIVLMRPTLVDSGVGGKKRGEPTALPAQDFQFYPFVRRMTKQVRDTPDGDITNVRYVLVGAIDADIQAADFFRHGDCVYDVESVDPGRTDRTAANVIYRGLASDESWG